VIVGRGVTMGVGEVDGREHPSRRPTVTAASKTMNAFDMQEAPKDLLADHSRGSYLTVKVDMSS